MSNNYVETQKIDSGIFFNAFKARIIIICTGMIIFSVSLRIYNHLISPGIDVIDIFQWFFALGAPIGCYFFITIFFSRNIFSKLNQISQVMYELDENLLRIQVKGEKYHEDIKEFYLEKIKQVKLKLNYFAIPIVPYVQDTLDSNNDRCGYSRNYVLRPGKKIEIRGTDYYLQITPTNNHDFLYQLHEHLKQIKNPTLIECSYNLENKIDSIKVHEH